MQFGAKHYEAAAQYLVEEAEKIQGLAAERDDMVAKVSATLDFQAFPMHTAGTIPLPMAALF